VEVEDRVFYGFDPLPSFVSAWFVRNAIRSFLVTFFSPSEDNQTVFLRLGGLGEVYA